MSRVIIHRSTQGHLFGKQEPSTLKGGEEAPPRKAGKRFEPDVGNELRSQFVFAVRRIS